MYEELVKRLLSYADLHCPLDRAAGICGCIDAREAAEAILKLSKPRWIPVTEKLPDVFKHVLVNIPGMAPHPTVQEAFYEKNGMWYSNGFRYGADEITHWQPIPTPPKEDSK